MFREPELIEIKLSAAGFANVNQAFLPNDFNFIIDGKEYPSNKIIADFFSPKIAQLHMADPTIDSFTIPLTNLDIDFDFFLNILKTGKIQIDESEIVSYIKLSKLLGNNEVIEQLIESHSNPEEFSEDNIITELNFAQTCEFTTDEMISYAASHFSEIFQKIDISIEYETIEDILSSPDFNVSDESYLLDFVIDLIETRGNDYKSFLSFIDIKKLNKSDLDIFLQYITPDQIDCGLWNNIKERLMFESISVNNDNGVNKKEIIPMVGKEFNGIIKYLNLSREVDINASSTLLGDVKTVIDLDNAHDDTRWFSQDEENSYVIFSFNKKKIALSHYAINTPQNCSQYLPFPKNWTVQGSNDKLYWITIHHKVSIRLKNPGSVRLYRCPTQSKPYKYIRFIQMGENHLGDHRFLLSKIELFGTIYDEKL